MRTPVNTLRRSIARNASRHDYRLAGMAKFVALPGDAHCGAYRTGNTRTAYYPLCATAHTGVTPARRLALRLGLDLVYTPVTTEQRRLRCAALLQDAAPLVLLW